MLYTESMTYCKPVKNALMCLLQKKQICQEGLDMSYSVACTFIEIYNESITDLVNPDAVGLAVRDDRHNGGLYVDGAQQVSVVSGGYLFICLSLNDAVHFFLRYFPLKNIRYSRIVN